MKKRNRNILNVGTSSLLVIFVILSLVTFATLSIVSANADYALSRTLDQRTGDYNRASNEAENFLNELDQQLLSIYKSSTSEADFFNKCQTLLSNPQKGASYEPGNKQLTFSKKISDRQSLLVVLTVNYPNAEKKGFYAITSWQEVNTDKWAPDTTLNLLPIQ